MKKTRQTNSCCSSSLHFHPHFHLSLIAVLFTYFLTVSPSIISLDGDYVVPSSRLARSSQKDDPNDPNFYKECSHSQDCPSEYCCTVGMQRYTRPFCSPLGQKNDVCRPDNPRQNFSLQYPKSGFTSFITLNVMESYLLLCPCAQGLECKRVDVGKCLLPDSNADADSYEDLTKSSESTEQ